MIMVRRLRELSNGSVQVGLDNSSQRAPVGETAVDCVPRRDLRFARLPTQKYYFAGDFARKIDESQLDIFEEAAEFFDLFREARHLLRQSAQLWSLADDLLETGLADPFASIASGKLAQLFAQHPRQPLQPGEN